MVEPALFHAPGNAQPIDLAAHLARFVSAAACLQQFGLSPLHAPHLMQLIDRAWPPLSRGALVELRGRYQKPRPGVPPLGSCWVPTRATIMEANLGQDPYRVGNWRIIVLTRFDVGHQAHRITYAHWNIAQEMPEIVEKDNLTQWKNWVRERRAVPLRLSDFGLQEIVTADHTPRPRALQLRRQKGTR